VPFVTLTIIIVAWNAREDLERCLHALTVSPAAIPHEIVVVDNGSEDGTPEMVRARFPAVRLMAIGENLGFAKANNLGISASSGELVLLLNPDTLVPAGAVDTLAQRLRATPVAAAAGPRIVDPDQRVELSFGPAPGVLGEAYQKSLGALYGAGVPTVRSWVTRRAARERFVDWVSGACLLVRRADAEHVGLLDERYFLYWEDVDFCSALRAQGRRILFTPAAEIVHARGRSTAQAPVWVRRWYREGQLAFYAKHRPAWLPVVRAYLRLTGQASR
jgi:GT2 family glycosyltransferase